MGIQKLNTNSMRARFVGWLNFYLQEGPTKKYVSFDNPSHELRAPLPTVMCGTVQVYRCRHFPKFHIMTFIYACFSGAK